MSCLATKKNGKQSLKEQFTSSIERQILSGELAIGQKLPPERELSEQTGISRTIVHAGLVELAARGVLAIAPRKGAFVADYRRKASLELYNALIKYSGTMDAEILRSLVEYRDIVEVSCARLAALNSTAEDVADMRSLVHRERAAASLEEAVDLDYELHISIIEATKNIILPMAIRSTEMLYKALVRQFYTVLQNREDVYCLQESLIDQIEKRWPRKAEEAMQALLEHGKNIVEQGIESSLTGIDRDW